MKKICRFIILLIYNKGEESQPRPKKINNELYIRCAKKMYFKGWCSYYCKYATEHDLPRLCTSTALHAWREKIFSCMCCDGLLPSLIVCSDYLLRRLDGTVVHPSASGTGLGGFGLRGAGASTSTGPAPSSSSSERGFSSSLLLS
jgi:hypothetical protein